MRSNVFLKMIELQQLPPTTPGSTWDGVGGWAYNEAGEGWGKGRLEQCQRVKERDQNESEVYPIFS